MERIRVSGAVAPSQTVQLWGARGLVGLAIAFFLYITFLPSLTTFRHGFPTYYVAARLLVEGRLAPEVYDNAWFAAEVARRTPNGVAEVFAPNPPSAALLMLPLAWLPMSSARQVWLWLSLGLLLMTTLLLARRAPAGPRWARAAVWALPWLLAPVHENFRLANVYGLLLFLFTLALNAFGRRAEAPASLSLGLAAGTKLSGSPLWLLLAVRGRWRALAGAAGVALALIAVSVTLTGLPVWRGFLTSLVEHANEPDWAAGLAFQTTPSFFQHLFRPNPVWNPQPPLVLPAWVARACTLAVSAAALLALAWRARSAPLDLAFAAALTLGVVILPFAEEYHYALLVLPLAIALSQLARGMPHPRRSGVVLLLVMALLALPWPYKDPWLNLGWNALLGYPRLYGGWLLWAWLMGAMATPSPAAQTRPEPARE